MFGADNIAGVAGQSIWATKGRPSWTVVASHKFDGASHRTVRCFGCWAQVDVGIFTAAVVHSLLGEDELPDPGAPVSLAEAAEAVL